MPRSTMRLFASCFALGLLLFAGCGSTVSMPAPLREKFAPTYHTQVVQADQRKTYEATKAALKVMNFRFQRGGPAQGKISAIGSLTTSQDFRGSRQLSLDVKLTQTNEGTEVAALFSEIREDDFSKRPGMGTSMPVRESGIYEAFFQHIQEALAASAK